MTKLFCLLILQISLSLQSSESGSDELENWSFELDSEGISEESSKPFSGRIYGGQEAEPSKSYFKIQSWQKVNNFNLQIAGHSLCPCKSKVHILEGTHSY